jgi:hypothetical protein
MTREVNKALMEHSTENRGENDEDMPSNGLDNAPVQGIAMQAVVRVISWLSHCAFYIIPAG